MSGQVRLLEMIARGAPVDESLVSIAQFAENMQPDCIAGVTVVDRAARTFERAIFPSLAPTYAAAIAGLPVSPNIGSCAKAVYSGTPVSSTDIENDKRFSPEWRKLGLDHGLRSIQSTPVKSQDDTPLGSFVLGFREAREVNDWEQTLVEVCAHLTALALRNARTQELQSLYVSELEHRANNLFATIGAVANATIKTYPDPKEFREAFQGRLHALAKAHHSMADTVRDGGDFQTILQNVLEPHLRSNKIEMSGPAISLASNAATSVSLAIHELATNAVKYGALSTSDGSVRIDWSIKPNDSEKIFEFCWLERNGPPVREPSRRGFGSTVIEKSLASAIEGTTSLHYAPDGFSCRVVAPFTDRLGSLR